VSGKIGKTEKRSAAQQKKIRSRIYREDNGKIYLEKH